VESIEVPTGELVLTVGADTAVGFQYPRNFDVLHVAPGLLAVADGMGAGEGSAAAGRIAMQVLATEVGADASPPRLRAVVGKAQRKVRAIGDQLGELAGCTLTALVPGASGDPHSGWIVHIGDSRAYRLRGGLLELLTVDHTAAWLGAIYGWYPADSPEAARARYHLTRYVGHPALPEPDVLSVALRPGDVYCLCTDGVSEPVRYETLAELMGSGAHPTDIVRALLAETLAAGGADNATAVVVRVDPARP